MGGELGSLGLLRILNLEHNRLAGTLPATWGEQMSALYHLRIINNSFQASPALRQLDVFRRGVQAYPALCGLSRSGVVTNTFRPPARVMF